jgi:membrane protein
MTLLKTAMISCLGWVRWLVRCFRQGDVGEEVVDADMGSSRGRAIAFLRQVLAVVGATIRRFSDEEGMHLAAGVAFYALLSSVPAALVTVSMFSYFLEPEEITDWLVNRLGEETPVSADFLLEAAQGARAIRGPVGVLGFLGAILSSTLFFAALMRSINRAWGLIGTGSRTFFRRKLWEFAFLFGLALLLLFAYAAANIYDVLKEGPLPGTDLRLAADNAVWRFFLGMVPFVAITGILLLLYRFVPTTEVKWRHVLLPSVLAGLALIIANGLLGWYIRNLSYYNVVYGSLAGVIVLLLWVYICANILIAGAALSATLGEMGRRQPLPDRRPNS